jgi:hypothetical protein
MQTYHTCTVTYTSPPPTNLRTYQVHSQFPASLARPATSIHTRTAEFELFLLPSLPLHSQSTHPPPALQAPRVGQPQNPEEATAVKPFKPLLDLSLPRNLPSVTFRQASRAPCSLERRRPPQNSNRVGDKVTPPPAQIHIPLPSDPPTSSTAPRLCSPPHYQPWTKTFLTSRPLQMPTLRLPAASLRCLAATSRLPSSSISRTPTFRAALAPPARPRCLPPCRGATHARPQAPEPKIAPSRSTATMRITS